MKVIISKIICLFLFLLLFPFTTHAATLFDTFAGIDPVNASGVAPSCNFTDLNVDCAAADDFVIVYPGWNISTIRVKGNYFDALDKGLSAASLGPASSVNVYILGDGGGLPDTTNLSAGSIYAVEDLAYTELGPVSGGDFLIPLPGNGVTLLAGTYWLVVQANIDVTTSGAWYWTESSLTPNSGTTNGYESAWFQPEEVYTSPPCTGSWNHRVTSCFMTFFSDPNPPADRDLAFQIEGNVLTAGVNVNPTTLTTVEGGVAKTYSVVLTAPPASGEIVTITPSSGDITEGTVSGALTFNSGNWDILQNVTVTPVSGDGVDGNITYSITNTVTSDNVGGDYNSVSAASVSVTNQNIDDSTPNAFSFTDQINVALNTLITSNSITVSDINIASSISVTGGEYEINGSGSWSSAASTVNSGSTVRVRHTSSGNNVTQTDTTLTIGGVSDTFSSTTIINTTVLDSPDGGNIGGTITFTASGQALSNLFTMTAGGNRPPGMVSPYGQIFYTVTAASGGLVTVSLNFSNALPVGFNLYKVDESGNYTEIPENVGSDGFWSQVDAHNIAITLLDNGIFDLNDTLGIVDDPIVLGFLTSTSIPTMNEWGMILMSVMMAGSALWMMRRRRISTT